MEILLLTESEVCERLRIGRSTLRKLWAKGTIRPVHIGRSLRFPTEEVERYVRELTAHAQVERER
jgi:excisionase family DNA binding protein